MTRKPPYSRIAASFRVSGADATGFLQGLLDQRRRAARAGRSALRGAAHAAGQDPVRHDRRARGRGDEPSYLIDCAAAQAADLAKRLGFYKLRAKVAIADESARPRRRRLLGRPSRRSVDGWPSLCRPARSAPRLARDPAPRRSPPRSGRSTRASTRACASPSARPRAASISPTADAFPHDANFDLLHGVDFDKGCYVGQEVVSRMKHRGTARKRVARVKLAGPRAAAGNAGPGPRTSRRRARLLLGARGAGASETRSRRGGEGGGPDIERGRRRLGAGGLTDALAFAGIARDPRGVLAALFRAARGASGR